MQRLEDVGLGNLLDRLDEETTWEHALSEYRADGARLVRDEALRTFGRSARLLSKLPTRRRARKA